MTIDCVHGFLQTDDVQAAGAGGTAADTEGKFVNTLYNNMSYLGVLLHKKKLSLQSQICFFDSLTVSTAF